MSIEVFYVLIQLSWKIIKI